MDRRSNLKPSLLSLGKIIARLINNGNNPQLQPEWKYVLMWNFWLVNRVGSRIVSRLKFVSSQIFSYNLYLCICSNCVIQDVRHQCETPGSFRDSLDQPETFPCWHFIYTWLVNGDAIELTISSFTGN